MLKFLLVQLLLLLAITRPATPATTEARKVTFSYSAVSMTWFPVKVALEKGFFRNEGIEPQLVQMNGNVATVALANRPYRLFSQHFARSQWRHAGPGN